MTQTSSTASERPPLRSWVLLPLLSLLTVAVLLVGAEATSRRLFHGSKTDLASCLVLNDPATGARGVPNSDCFYKSYEDKALTEYKFNSCGHRTGTECGPKAPGEYRLVFVGSSMVFGYHSPWNRTFVALTGKGLSQETGRKVEAYNEGMYWGTPHRVAVHLDEALAAQPDAIVWPITPFDVEKAADLQIEGPAENGGAKDPAADKSSTSWLSLPERLEQKSRITLMLRHFLYESRSQYLRHFLVDGDQTEFLKADPAPEWRSDLRQFDSYYAEVAAKAAAAGVPVVVTVLPVRAQAAMIASGEWSPDLDPYKFGEEVRAIVEQHGGTYVDILHGFRSIPSPEDGYLPVDGHPNAEGNAIFSDLLVKGLASALPALNNNSVGRLR